MGWGVVAAVAAAVCYGVASVLQAVGARRVSAGNPLRGSFHDFECHDHLFESRISQLSTGYVEWQSSM